MNSDQDVALKLAQERAEIVAKYDRGREGAEIEPWEDADYLVYKVTDRFGFLHEEELPYHNAAVERRPDFTNPWTPLISPGYTHTSPRLSCLFWANPQPS